MKKINKRNKQNRNENLFKNRNVFFSKEKWKKFFFLDFPSRPKCVTDNPYTRLLFSYLSYREPIACIESLDLSVDEPLQLFEVNNTYKYKY